MKFLQVPTALLLEQVCTGGTLSTESRPRQAEICAVKLVQSRASHEQGGLGFARCSYINSSTVLEASWLSHPSVSVTFSEKAAASESRAGCPHPGRRLLRRHASFLPFSWLVEVVLCPLVLCYSNSCLCT